MDVSAQHLPHENSKDYKKLSFAAELNLQVKNKFLNSFY